MTKLAEEILNKIEKEEIKPIPKWKFLVNGYLLWGVFILNLILGSISVAISFFLLTNSETFSDSSLTQNPLQWLIYSIPFFWIFFTIIFVFISYYNFKHTEKGHRLGFLKFICLNVCVTLLLGFTLNLTGLASGINKFFSQNIPLYNQVADLRSEVWMRPEEGYLAGKILSINESNTSFKLQDLNNKVWTIEYSKANIRRSTNFIESSEIKIVGEKINENYFSALEIRPWSGMMNGMQEMRGMMRNNY